MLGNYANWKVHATGLREMVRTRGGMLSVEPGLQMKIYRYDAYESSAAKSVTRS